MLCNQNVVRLSANFESPRGPLCGGAAPTRRRLFAWFIAEEVLRVLKPGGQFLFIEHVAAPPGARLRRIQNLVTPIWRRMGDGCHPKRKTRRALEKAGSATLEIEEFDVLVPIVKPHIAGIAVKG